MDNQAKVAQLTAAGLALVAIPPVDGKPSKAPRSKGWNKPRSSNNPNGYSSDSADFKDCSKDTNFGLYHDANNTLALDLDDLELSKKIFEELADNQLSDWIENEQRAEVKSPKANRGKLLYKLPADFANAGLRQLKHDNKTICELRSGNCQDVIIGQHPEGGDYQFVGNPAAIPEAPAILLDMLQHWDTWKPCFESVLDIAPKIASNASQKKKLLPGSRDPIQEFNQSFSVTDVLTRNDYIQKGKDRFLRPNSESKAPGVAIMRNCADGVERVYSHGSDVLNDGYAHDAFDCFRLLECGGDFKKAMNWNPDFTQHNQQLYAQEKAAALTQPPVEVKRNFPLVSGSILANKQLVIRWLIRSILEAGCTGMLFGVPVSGKSLFALDWAFCIATGIDWHGHKTEQGDVVVIVGEGMAGIQRRLKALEKKYAIQTPENLFFSAIPAQLDNQANAILVAEAVQTACHNPVLVIVDTMHRNVLCDENSAKEIGVFISNLDQHFKPLGVAVLIVHHSGVADQTRGRGSSSIKAAMDAEFCVNKEGMASVLTCTKAKDFEPFEPMAFGIHSVELDEKDDEGEPITSVYLIEATKEISHKKKPLSKNALIVIDELRLLQTARPVDVVPDEIKQKYPDIFGGNLEPAIVHIADWRAAIYPVLDVVSSDPVKEKVAKEKAFLRARTELKNLKKLYQHGDYWWIPPSSLGLIADSGQ